MKYIYHYCSTDTFLKIVQNKELWLSALTQSNDATEGRLVTRAAAAIAEEEGISIEKTELALHLLRAVEDIWGGLGICFSEESDLLSQWRAYSQNGTGLCIGFAENYIDGLAKDSIGKSTDVKLIQVRYDLSDQKLLLKPILSELLQKLEQSTATPADVNKVRWDSRDFETLEKPKQAELLDLLDIAMSARELVFSFKHEAFKQEHEWRLLHEHDHESLEGCKFYSTGSTIKPYKIIELGHRLFERSISEVVLGPRNNTPISVVSGLLIQYDYPDVQVRRSSAPYR